MRKLIVDLLRRSENALFGKHLLLTNTVSSGLLMLIGEIAAQRLDKSNKDKHGQTQYDIEKQKQMTVVGISQGPLHHYTYLWMERLLPGNSKMTVMKKILSDQLIVSPVFITHFFYTTFFLARKPLQDTNDLLFTQGKFLTVYLFDWIIWPPTQFINFYYLPARYRVLYINAITMFYNIFLCYVKNQSNEVTSVE